MNIFIAFFFGIFGGMARMLLSDVLPKAAGFPWGTLIINLVGCFVFGFLIKHYFVVKNVHERIILAAGTGFIGTFTTFSSLVLDAVKFLEHGNYEFFALYLFLEITGSLFFLIAGIGLGRLVIEA